MLSIALSELVQTLRNRSVLLTAFIMPVAASGYFVWQHEVFEGFGRGMVAALVVFTVGAFGLYGSIVTTLAARRQNLFLKRLRSTSASDAGILVGMVLPAAALATVQIGLMLVVLGIVVDMPDDPVLVVLATVLVLAMLVALALATAGVTRSPEHAQVTTLPISLGIIAVVNWVAIAGTAELALLKRLLPGGAATELLTEAWAGGTAGADVALLIAPTLAWVAIAAVLANRFFQWEPRR
jgi:ABC-2 type transport system permease protein